MALLRSTTLALWLTTLTSIEAISTPIRDLSQETIAESQCDWPNFQEDDDLNGVMVLYKGHKLTEWRNPNSQNNEWFGSNFVEGTSQHAQYSVTKTWISVLVGMLYRDGFLDWETEHPDKITLGEIFPEKIWEDMWDIPYPISGKSHADVHIVSSLKPEPYASMMMRMMCTPEFMGSDTVRYYIQPDY